MGVVYEWTALRCETGFSERIDLMMLISYSDVG